mmetsp:Transcript_113086/g.365264  ORF Transcript_113086/g.365264 Transcript_113086/m.365264 type:complete len:219 (+) Transcript_113086:1212-1868(+)
MALHASAQGCGSRGCRSGSFSCSTRPPQLPRRLGCFRLIPDEAVEDLEAVGLTHDAPSLAQGRADGRARSRGGARKARLRGRGQRGHAGCWLVAHEAVEDVEAVGLFHNAATLAQGRADGLLRHSDDAGQRHGHARHAAAGVMCSGAVLGDRGHAHSCRAAKAPLAALLALAHAKGRRQGCRSARQQLQGRATPHGSAGPGREVGRRRAVRSRAQQWP